MDFGPVHHGNGFLDVPGCHNNGSKDHPKTVPMPNHHSNGCHYGPSGYRYPVSHQNGYGYPHTNGGSEIGDLLQDYLGQGKGMIQKNSGARHVVSREKKKNSSQFPGLMPHCIGICRPKGNLISVSEMTGCLGCITNMLITSSWFLQVC